ncbi:hypothetical protein [Microbulbifer sp. SAOS-129_SWC]|uniref:hypothetical protein n=1 Tax=Microbulbifer sp. SAOS-129_SWC TaxID=3145235 RepID=UPI003216BBF0
MRIKIISIIMLLSFPVCSQEIRERIIDVQNIYFMVYSGDRYKEIFRTPENSSIYGYGLITNDKAVFAYQDPERAAAIAILDVIDIDSGKKIHSARIVDAGETSFDFSIDAEKGVFNDSEGLSTVQLGESGLIIKPIAEIKEAYPYAPFWIDAQTIGYSFFADDKQTFGLVNIQ